MLPFLPLWSASRSDVLLNLLDSNVHTSHPTSRHLYPIAEGPTSDICPVLQRQVDSRIFRTLSSQQVATRLQVGWGGGSVCSPQIKGYRGQQAPTEGQAQDRGGGGAGLWQEALAEGFRWVFDAPLSVHGNRIFLSLVMPLNFALTYINVTLYLAVTLMIQLRKRIVQSSWTEARRSQ